MVDLKIKALTFNSAYPTNRTGRRFLTREGKQYKYLISSAAKKSLWHMENEHVPLCFEYTISSPRFLKKNGEISKTAGDCDGFAKLLIDAVCESLGIDDSCVWKIVGQKKYGTTESVKFDLYHLTANEI